MWKSNTGAESSTFSSLPVENDGEIFRIGKSNQLRAEAPQFNISNQPNTSNCEMQIKQTVSRSHSDGDTRPVHRDSHEKLMSYGRQFSPNVVPAIKKIRNDFENVQGQHSLTNDRSTDSSIDVQAETEKTFMKMVKYNPPDFPMPTQNFQSGERISILHSANSLNGMNQWKSPATNRSVLASPKTYSPSESTNSDAIYPSPSSPYCNFPMAYRYGQSVAMSPSNSIYGRHSMYDLMGSNRLSLADRPSPQKFNHLQMEPTHGYIYQVQFKRAHRNFILAPSAPTNIIPGDYVKVEADRGEDLGIVLSKQLASDFEEVIPTAGYRGRGFSSGQGERKFLFRLATNEEKLAITLKLEDEERALMVIREKVLERAIPMSILDAEYQFDRHKLTYYFAADKRIDFRELVSELFSLYKTRIWMQQVDTSVLQYDDTGMQLSKAAGFLPIRDDYMFSSPQNNDNFKQMENHNSDYFDANGPQIDYMRDANCSLFSGNDQIHHVSTTKQSFGVLEDKSTDRRGYARGTYSNSFPGSQSKFNSQINPNYAVTKDLSNASSDFEGTNITDYLSSSSASSSFSSTMLQDTKLFSSSDQKPITMQLRQESDLKEERKGLGYRKATPYPSFYSSNTDIDNPILNSASTEVRSANHLSRYNDVYSGSFSSVGSIDNNNISDLDNLFDNQACIDSLNRYDSLAMTPSDPGPNNFYTSNQTVDLWSRKRSDSGNRQQITSTIAQQIPNAAQDGEIKNATIESTLPSFSLGGVTDGSDVNKFWSGFHSNI